jgi:predicted metal-dependent hydrolase
MPNLKGKKGLEYEYLRKWIRNRLQEVLNSLVTLYERKMKAPISRLYIKNQKTRWASYSPKRNVNFNIKLAALPKNVIEYVIIHELAHTMQHRHNKKFWYIVEKFCPDYERRRQELKGYSVIIQKNKVWQKILKT